MRYLLPLDCTMSYQTSKLSLFLSIIDIILHILLPEYYIIYDIDRIIFDIVCECMLACTR